MRRIILTLSGAIALTAMMSSATHAQIQIELFNRSGNTGAVLDGVNSFDLPYTTPVLEDTRTGPDQLTLSVTGLTGTGAFDLNGGTSGTLGFGINSSGLDNAFDFEADLNESVTFAFNQDLFITEIDLNRTLAETLGDVFEVGSVIIEDY